MSTHIIQATMYPMYHSKYSDSRPSGYRCRMINPCPFGVPEYMYDKVHKDQFLGYHQQTKEIFVTLKHPLGATVPEILHNKIRKSKSTREHVVINKINWVGKVNMRVKTNDFDLYIPRAYWHPARDWTGNIKLDMYLYPCRMFYKPFIVARLVGIKYE